MAVIDGGQCRTPHGSRQSSSIAMRQYTFALTEQRGAIATDALAHFTILFMNSFRFLDQIAVQHGFVGRCRNRRSHAVQGPEQVDCSGTTGCEMICSIKIVLPASARGLCGQAHTICRCDSDCRSTTHYQALNCIVGLFNCPASQRDKFLGQTCLIDKDQFSVAEFKCFWAF